MTKAVLLLNLGSPQSTSKKDISRFLGQFLIDWRVINIPAIGRWLLVNLIIRTLRPAKIQPAYKRVWMGDSSPLHFHVNNLKLALAKELQGIAKVDFAMRYGNPSIPDVLSGMIAEGVDEICIMPLYPQYASATTGSSIEQVFAALTNKWHVPTVKVIAPYFNKDFFIDAQAQLAAEFNLAEFDFFLFSYHGIPLSHLKIGENRVNICAQNDCCETITADNSYCYRAQSVHCTKALVKKLNLDVNKTMTVFQSKFGNDPWTTPSLVDSLKLLAEQGKKNILIFCPSFTADCIETIDEVSNEAKDLFIEHGGTNLVQVPCVNSSKLWVDNLTQYLKQTL